MPSHVTISKLRLQPRTLIGGTASSRRMLPTAKTLTNRREEHPALAFTHKIAPHYNNIFITKAFSTTLTADIIRHCHRGRLTLM